jgi:hypothetical protein
MSHLQAAPATAAETMKALISGHCTSPRLPGYLSWIRMILMSHQNYSESAPFACTREARGARVAWSPACRCDVPLMQTRKINDFGDAISPRSSLTSDRAHATSPRSSLTSDRAHATSPRSSLTSDRAHATSPRSSLTSDRADATSPRSSLTGDRADATSPRSSLTADPGDATPPRTSPTCDPGGATSPERHRAASRGMSHPRDRRVPAAGRRCCIARREAIRARVAG